MSRKLRHIILMLALVPMAVLHHSCTEVELCDVNNHPHLSSLALKFYWDEALIPEGYQRPDSMMVMASRVINAWRTGFIVQLPETDGETVTEGLTIFGELELPTVEESPVVPEVPVDPEIPVDPEAPADPETPENPSDQENPDNPDNQDNQDNQENPENQDNLLFLSNSRTSADPESSEEDTDLTIPSDTEEAAYGPLYLKGGEYQFIAINWDSKECEVDRIEEFKQNLTIGSKELFIRFKTYLKDDPKLHSLGRAWIDYNSYGRFMASDITPTYLGLASICPVDVGKQAVIEIRPKRITQRYNMLFSIKKEPGVRIEQVIAVIAGIPYRYGLSTRNVDVSYTNKMAFNAEIHPDTVALYPNHYTGEPGALDGDTIIHYQALFNSIGLVRSNSPSLAHGPGLLQLCVYTSTQRPGSTQRVNRTIYGMINLYNTIGDAHPMQVIDDNEGKYMQQQGDSITLDIATVLEIKNGEVLESNTESATMDTWKEVHSFNVDM